MAKKSQQITTNNIKEHFELMTHEERLDNLKFVKRTNIEFLYPLMDEEMKKICFTTIDLMFSKWKRELVKHFGSDHKIICKSDLFKAVDNFLISEDGYFNVGLKAFEVIDTLKPLDEYIKEIIKSESYQDYVIEMGIPIMRKVKLLDIPHDHHCSDLYLFVNELTKKLVDKYEHKVSVTTFKSQTDGEMMYDIPFAYYK